MSGRQLPGSRYVLGVAELVRPLRPLVGDQAPPRRPEYVSLCPGKDRIDDRYLRNRKSLDPYTKRPRPKTEPLVSGRLAGGGSLRG